MKKNGFTLVELLAVIVILAVVMLIGVTAVLPLMTRAQRNALASEGIGLIDTGKAAFQAEQLDESELKLPPNESYCFSIDWLRKHNYYDKASNKYSGSLLVLYNKQTLHYDYYFWITNGNYHISGGTADDYTIEDGPGDDTLYTCGGIEVNGSNSSSKCSLPERVLTYTDDLCQKIINSRMTPDGRSMDAYCDGDTIYYRYTGDPVYSAYSLRDEPMYKLSDDVYYTVMFRDNDTTSPDDDDSQYYYYPEYINGWYIFNFNSSPRIPINTTNNNSSYSIKPLINTGQDAKIVLVDEEGYSDFSYSSILTNQYIDIDIINYSDSSKTLTLNLDNNTGGQYIISKLIYSYENATPYDYFNIIPQFYKNDKTNESISIEVPASGSAGLTIALTQYNNTFSVNLGCSAGSEVDWISGNSLHDDLDSFIGASESMPNSLLHSWSD